MSDKDMGLAIVESRFGKQADRIKISRKHYAHDINSCVLKGRSEAVETILNRHKSNPYLTVSELLGDIQLDLVKYWGDFHKLFPTMTRPISIDHILQHTENTEKDR